MDISRQWPEIQKGEVVNCVSMFIDIRNSSRRNAEPASRLGDAAILSTALSDAVSTIWQTSAAPTPKTVRIYGDGIFCAWPFGGALGGADYEDARISILDTAVKLVNELPNKIKELANIKDDIKIGIGLNDGQAVESKINLVNGEVIFDYYGPSVDLAAKLQSLAKEHGLIVTEYYLPNNDKFTVLGLRKHVIQNPVDDTALTCWATQNILQIVNWTCLAWPGFALASEENQPNRMSLHHNGITVLTHEGLSGKIESLKIWNRNEFRKTGDSFEVIIEDFDGIDDLNARKQVNLAKPVPGLPRSVAHNIGNAVHNRTVDFYFKPIRCGLNAVAFNVDVKSDILKCKSYEEIIQLGHGGSKFKMGLYDNAGASMNVILNAFQNSANTTDSEHFGTDASDINKIIDKLDRIQKKGEKIFRLFTTIENLATSLQTGGEVDVVLGGGAWLGNPVKYVEDESATCASDCSVEVFIPDNSKGFIWIEGASVLARAASSRKSGIESFRNDIRRTLLDEDYQLGLVDGLSYGTVPVQNSALMKLLSKPGFARFKENKAAQLTVREAHLMFRLSERERIETNGNCFFRRRPTHSNAWQSAWSEIRERFCEQF